MRKRFLTFLLAGVMCASLAACGDSADTPRYAVTLIHDPAAGSNEAMVQSAVEQAAADAGYISRVYVAADNTEEALEDVFKQVSEEKIKLAVAYGKDMEIPIWNAQKNHRKVKYALIDGVPRKSEDESDEIRDNTMCAGTAYEDMGFLAGYAAVKNGSRKLAFIAGEKNDLNIRYAGGFIQGCVTAASEMSLGNDAVSITGVYSGSDELTPLRMSDALSLYGDGAEIIFTVNNEEKMLSGEGTTQASTQEDVVNDLGNGTTQDTTAETGSSWICTANLGAPSNYTNGGYRLVLVQNINGQDTETVIAEGATSLEFPYLLQVSGAEGVTDGMVYLYENVEGEYVPRVTWPVTFELQN